MKGHYTLGLDHDALQVEHHAMLKVSALVDVVGGLKAHAQIGSSGHGFGQRIAQIQFGIGLELKAADLFGVEEDPYQRAVEFRPGKRSPLDPNLCPAVVLEHERGIGGDAALFVDAAMHLGGSGRVQVLEINTCPAGFQ